MTAMSSPITERLIEQVAETTGTDPLELPSLYETIDPDALNTAVATMTGGSISFRYAGHDVTVYSTGRIALTERMTHQQQQPVSVRSDD